MAIDEETFMKWQEWSKRDDAWKLFVPSDIRVMLAEIERMERALSSICGFAPGNGDVCEVIAQMARYALDPKNQK